MKGAKLCNVYISVFVINTYSYIVIYQANQVQFGETNQATVVIDEPLKQHEAINDKQLDDAVADMTNPEPSTEMQNNQCELFETNLEEPFDLQGN